MHKGPFFETLPPRNAEGREYLAASLPHFALPNEATLFAYNTFPRLSTLSGHADEQLKSVASRGELGFDPTVDASVEDIEREGAAGEDLVMEGLEVELGA